MKRKTIPQSLGLSLGILWLIIFSTHQLGAQTHPLAKTGFADVHMHLMAAPQQQQQQMKGPPRFSRGPGPGGRGPQPQRKPGSAQQVSPAKDYTSSAAQLITLMDRLGVGKVLIMPPPQSPSNQGTFLYKDLLAVVTKYQGRLYFAAGGDFLNPLIMSTDPKAVTKQIQLDFETKARQILADGAKAFGEMTALHFSLAARHAFEQTDPDHPLFLVLADLAAQSGVPIDLHIEAVPADQPLPANLVGLSPNNPTQIKATIPGLERLLTHNRKANIVWQHLGWDNTGHMKVDLLRRLLKNHPNLYMALKILPKNSERPGININNPLDDAGKIKADWLALLAEFPDRFVVGADEFVAAPGQWHPGSPSFESSWNFLKQLPHELQMAIGRNNAVGLYHLE